MENTQGSLPRMSPRTRLIVIWTVVGGYAGGIFALSSISNLPDVPARLIPHFDKLCHAIAYAGLTLGLIYALALTFPTRTVSRLLLMAAILAVCYGVINEFHQLFRPRRTMSFADIVANAVGAALVVWIWPRIRRLWPSAVPLRNGGTGCMPRVEYCYSCGSEIERYEFTECKACHEYFCEDCVSEDELCDQCCESVRKEEA
jgi:VanZ family protein